MAEKLRFNGRVAVVTGAGAGLGRTYALLLAERGASVVVNDLGGGRHGDGSSTKAADTVVEEIKAKGGKAVPDYNSVEDGEKIIQTALDNFGRVDILINNAGILRDRTFARISDQDWDLVHRVHLKGSFKTTQAAWPHMRKQQYGRIIMTSSQSGLCGNFGQANYSAAKYGLVGLNNTLALEGDKYNIHCNTIVPTAASRLTEDILPPDMFAELRPCLIAPVVAWLCHESCGDNGSIIDSGAGYAAQCQMYRGEGVSLRKRITDDLSIEDVRDSWEKVTDMSKATPLTTIQAATSNLMTVLEELRTAPASGKVVKDKFSYTPRDLIIYALGVGASTKNPDDLRFLYENHEDFAALPSFYIIPGQMVGMFSGLIDNAIPGKTVDPTQLLHGEQFVEILKPISTSGTLTNQCQIADVLDKGSKGAVILMDIDTFDEEGDQVAHSQMTVFIRGAGEFGGRQSSNKQIMCADRPKRKADASRIQATILDQAALYRLSGDANPLHIDPNFASMGGFDRPILHGMATLGFATKHVLELYAGNDPSLVKTIKVRFTKPVLPGHTLKTDMWREGHRIHFETSTIETGNIVISGAYMDLKEVQPAVNLHKVAAESLKCEEMFNDMRKRMEADPATAKKINGVFLYNITKNGQAAGKWVVDLKQCKLYKGDAEPGVKVDTTLTVDDQDMIDITTGKLNPQVAFMKQKLKITGNIMLTQKLQGLLKAQSKL
ncbi:peroxisomal multifunctional enzyme type 2 [Frankliniella occidentalis]|uniref:Peroxisomal multifunctional enzyme type 2 n=1 Tax=Frankliniella occidentalis TaxID=133901 RepID=A0A6J1T0A3_FRAOC|nr:peroxisomal multifunctional enzyme type 2 [Frankliniella occidentalis]XP_026286946.1 peroxisomal multifunctional enzyme type 2 [Frankliniella occidentalis]